MEYKTRLRTSLAVNPLLPIKLYLIIDEDYTFKGNGVP